ncbi:PTS sugar transporter subunit IIB [Enorma burkinafasonensis]|uniref:PTS sugar transporter subunit IIB n=1 Tax=Enorma burkinafasonensis TaxID=2590867 RepID=UPI0011A5B81F|nr:PTS sugar transporter subunit IIB [Enorma burkinafasonensis]MCI7730481.1 PTS sugar transporter subunit IIB [Enorma burkinafasonensis]
MKKIVLACGSGIATSTAVAQKVSTLLNDNGYEGQYEIVQCAISEAKETCADADLLVATTVAPEGLACPYVSGVPFLTGVGRPAAEQEILAVMAQ